MAEAVRRAAFETWVRYCDQGAIREDDVYLDAIIASVPAPDVQAQIDADDGVCPRHGCAVCEECAIDAAVAREREACAEIVARESRHRERLSLSSKLLQGIEKEIRARSGVKE